MIACDFCKPKTPAVVRVFIEMAVQTLPEAGQPKSEHSRTKDLCRTCYNRYAVEVKDAIGEAGKFVSNGGTE